MPVKGGLFPPLGESLSYLVAAIFSSDAALRRWWATAVDVLACPHCDRSFQVTPASLGKKIRCRGCRGIFHVPHDTTNVPLGQRQLPGGEQEESLPPLAVHCLIDGEDARSCPACGRTFRMRAAFDGKTIRCRGCKVTFRVRATEFSVPAASQSERRAVSGERSAAPSLPARPFKPPPPPRPSLPAASRPSTIYEDMGDVLDELLPGEEVASVVRSRTLAVRPASGESPVATILAVVLGGVCAIPIAMILLRIISPKQFELIVDTLPRALSGWMR